MPYSNSARKRAALGKSIRKLFGQQAYENWKRSGVIPPGLEEARRRNKYKYRGGSLPVKGSSRSISPTASSQPSPKRTRAVRPIVSRSGGSRASGTIKSSSAKVDAARRMKLSDIVTSTGVNQANLVAAFPPIHPNITEVNRNRIARSVIHYSSSHPNGEAVFRSLRNAYLVSPKSLYNALQSHLPKESTTAHKRRKTPVHRAMAAAKGK